MARGRPLASALFPLRQPFGYFRSASLTKWSPAGRARLFRVGRRRVISDICRTGASDKRVPAHLFECDPRHLRNGRAFIITNHLDLTRGV